MKAQAKAREADQPISVWTALSSGSVTVVFGAQLHTTNLKQGKRCQLCGCKPRRRWSIRSAPLRGAPNPSPLARGQKKVPPQKETKLLTITFLLLLLFLPTFLLFFIYLIVGLLLPIFLVLLDRKQTSLQMRTEHHSAPSLLPDPAQCFYRPDHLRHAP